MCANTCVLHTNIIISFQALPLKSVGMFCVRIEITEQFSIALILWAGSRKYLVTKATTIGVKNGSTYWNTSHGIFVLKIDGWKTKMKRFKFRYRLRYEVYAGIPHIIVSVDILFEFIVCCLHTMASLTVASVLFRFSYLAWMFNFFIVAT